MTDVSPSDHAAGEPRQDWADLAARASRDARGVPAELLEGYLSLLAKVSTGWRPGQEERDRRREIGAHAAEQEVPMLGVIDLYLGATWLAWPLLPGVRAALGADALRHTGEAVLRAADVAITAVAEGYEEAQRWSLRREESLRREFVDDLLDGHALETLPERAERYGLGPMDSFVVVAAAGTEPCVDGGPATRRVESHVHRDPRSRNVLVTTKDGLLVCVAPDGGASLEEPVARVVETLTSDGAWRVGIGGPQRGPRGAARSFEQATQALDIGQRLKLPGRVHAAADLLVYQVLTRDRAALADLVTGVLEPLRSARVGPETLLETLLAYFATGRVATAAARELHVGVRTVTYRLERIEKLTGYSAYKPHQSFTLQVAAFGARLLGWPGDV